MTLSHVPGLEKDEFFREEELISFLQGLVQTDSQNPPGLERAAAEYIARFLEDNGIPVEWAWPAPDRPNIKAVLQGSLGEGPALLYNGHLDVVPAGSGWTKPPFGAIIEDGRLYGRGAADMKSGVAAMAYAAVVLKRRGLPFAGKLILYFNMDEERSNIGIKHLVEDNLSADYAVISEPTDLDACIGHKGVSRYRVHTRGQAGHTAVVQQPDNAIYKMTKLVAALEELAAEVGEHQHPLLGRSSLTVAQINGGTAPNIVPAHTVIEIDRRLMPDETAESAYGQLDNKLEAAARHTGFTYELEQYQHLPAYIIDENHLLVRTMLDIARQVTGTPRAVKPFEASAEAPFLAVDKGIPTLIFGPGSLRQAHTADEYVAVEEAVQAGRIFAALACALLRRTEG